MDLASMLQREDFFTLFFPTVEKYFREALNTEIKFSFVTDKEKCNMVIKPRLSAVSSVYISKRAREFYYSEWNIRKSFLKNCAAKAYVFLMTRTGHKFSQYKFKMLPEPDSIYDLIIAPNNRSIRIFDYGKGVVGCIIKEGFTDKFFNNQIDFRKNYHYDFILPMICYEKNWFQEPIMHGHPLARISNKKLYDRAIKDSLKDICILAKDTLQYEASVEYISKLFEKIKRMIVDAENEKGIKYAQEAKCIAEFAIQEAMLFDKAIPTVVSHGDFQSGNIWVDQQEKVWIYDWETVGRRSIWYDTAVLCYSLRRHNGWKDLIEIESPSYVNLCDVDYSSYTFNQYRGIKGIVLLEDLIFYLEDMLELPENWGVEIFDAFIERIMMIDQVKNSIYGRKENANMELETFYK